VAKRKTLAFERHLHALILPNRAVKEEPGTSSGECVLVVPVNYNRPGLKLLAKALKASAEKRYILDGTGLQVYRMIGDGMPFEELVDRFAAAHLLSFFEARAFLMDYLRTLVERGIVVIGIKEIHENS
jgi:hypothetical protein